MGNLTRAGRNIAWIEAHCRIPEGRDVGKAVKLRSWQKHELRRIYDGDTRTFILSFGRKNGKTALAAFILLLHICGPEARTNSQLVSAAQTRDQAALVHGLAAKTARLSPTLNPVLVIRDTKKEIGCPEIGTLYRALSADASNNLGTSPVLAIHDELGEVRGPRSDLYTAIEQGMSAHEDPLSVVISTQAPTDADLLSILIDDAIESKDPRTKVSLYTSDPDADAFGEDQIKAANPAFGDFQNRKTVLKNRDDARRMPALEAEYRNKVLNQRVEVNSPYVSKGTWDANGGEPLADFGDLPVYCGLDLSATNDLTAFVMVCAVGGVVHIKPTFWLPKEGLVEKARLDRVPYDVWEKSGHLITCEGRTVDYSFVAAFLRGAFDRYNIQKVAFDRWNMKHFLPWLDQAGLKEDEVARFEEFGQGFQSMSPALRDLDTVLLNERMRHGSHPVLNMCAANSVVKADPAGNRKLIKLSPNKRIDGMIALAMAESVRARDEGVEAEPNYQMLFV